ncbi:TPA: MBL fold metallo-hydrolase [Candidatus Bathyarchaeota archaeon]|nr:MBL fold metallo-hydrolase [Candidatus Bathyarchaeota archaeon]
MVRNLRLTILVEDQRNPQIPNMEAKHGLCIYAEAAVKDECFVFLLDTGPSSDVLRRNAEILKIDLSKVKGVFLTHGHYDHTGGLLEVLKHIDRNVPVIAHPLIFEPKFGFKPVLTYIGMSLTMMEVKNLGASLLLSRNPVQLMEGVSTTGEIERVTSYEKVEGLWTVSRERFIPDILLDDQSLIFKIEGKGLVIISGCAHSGIVNTVIHSRNLMKVDKIHAVIGGFHLKDADKEKIQQTINDLAAFNPELICPCHCTGRKATAMFKDAFGNDCLPVKTGDTVEL